jgi:hypothetical protein
MLMANQDQNLNYAWQVQKLGATAGQTGYAQNAVAPASATVSAAEQVSAGAPSPLPGNVTQILENPGYAGNPALMSPGAIASALVPVPATTVAFQNPTGLNCQVSVVGGTVTAIAVAPLVNGAAGTFTTIATATGATVSVPPGGFVKLTYSSAPTWVWVATN